MLWWLARRRQPYVSLPSGPSSIPKVFGDLPRSILCDGDRVLWLPEQFQLFLCVSPSARGPRPPVSPEWPETFCDECDVHHRAGHG
jgi:hypothetical protein